MDEQERFIMLRSAMETGANYIDLDIETDLPAMEGLIPIAHSRGCDVILSFHDYEKTPLPEELDVIVKKCINGGADIFKVACQVNQTVDLVNLFQLYRYKYRKVIIGMGEKGLISRVAAPLLGAEFTFASTGEGRETAPGQISKERLLGILEQLK